jgi:hypothetical protein
MADRGRADVVADVADVGATERLGCGIAASYTDVAQMLRRSSRSCVRKSRRSITAAAATYSAMDCSW